MAMVTQEQMNALTAFLNSLTGEQKSKCAVCSKTLTHFVKKAEAETGCGTATITNALAERMNEGAAPEDRVTGESLRQKVRQAEGSKRSIGPNSENTIETGGKGGDTGDISMRVDSEIGRGKSEREAARVVAGETGKSPEAVKKAHQREKAKKTEKLEIWTCATCGKDSPTTEGFCNSCAAPMPMEKPQKREDSKNLFNLKWFWVRANKKDRLLFREWIVLN